MCWSKLSMLGRDNADFLLSAALKIIPEVGHWKIKDPPKTERFYIQIMASSDWALPHYFYFSPINNTWLNQTSVLTHTSNICLPVNILPRRICKIGSQIRVGWGLQTARIKLHHSQREIFVIIQFWMLTFPDFFWDLVAEQRGLSSEIYYWNINYWKCSQISTLALCKL